MGVPSVWEMIKPGFDKRVAFPVLVNNFYIAHHRPIRIAIDAYQWIFECSVPTGIYGAPMKLQISTLLRNFHSRLRMLIRLNVSFILVFDGEYKPKFKRKFDESENENLANASFEEYYEQMLKNAEHRDSSGKLSESADITALKNELRSSNIEYIDALSEGEAEASRLQALGIVDYILTNDSDCIIYGAKQILRNFSKTMEDKPASSSLPRQEQEFWCTPVSMQKVRETTGFDQYRVLLFSILKGADYNAGVQSIGSEKAGQYALSSTNFIRKYDKMFQYETLPDFAYILKNIFLRNEGGADKLPDPTERRNEYERFQKACFDILKNFSREVFGRNEKAMVSKEEFSGFPPDFVVMLYFHPVFCYNTFHFTEGKTNNGESLCPTLFETIDFRNSLNKFRDYPPANVGDIQHWFSKNLSEAFLLKAINSGVRIPAVLERLKVADEKLDQFETISVRFQNYLLDQKYVDVDEVATKNSKHPLDSKYLTWLPAGLILKESKPYQEFLEALEKKREADAKKISSKASSRRSPKKLTQKSTLVSLGYIPDTKLNTATLGLSVRRKGLNTKQSTTIDDIILEKRVLDSTKSIDPGFSKHSILFEENDSESAQSSPLKATNLSPSHRVESEINSIIQQSPIKRKPQRCFNNSSLPQGHIDRFSTEDDIPREYGTEKTPRRRLIFSAPEEASKTSVVQHSTTADISIISIDSVSEINDSSLMEISRIENDKVLQTGESIDALGTTPKEHDPCSGQKFRAMDSILAPMDFSSSDDEDGEH